MKKFAAVLFPIVALFAPGVHADGDSAPTGDGSWWYTPDAGFQAETAKGTVYYFDEDTGVEKSSTITVDNEGNVSGSEVPFGDDYALKTAYEAMKAALQDAAVLKLHETAIETIGARLNSMYGQNMQLTIGIGGYKNTDSTISITPGKDGENAKFEIADNIPYAQMVDGKTLAATSDGRFQLYSADAPADRKVDLLSNVADAGVYLPMLLNGYLRWGEWSGADADVFEYKKRDGNKATRLELRGFKDGEYTMESSTLSKLLTSSDVDSWAKRGEVRIPVRWKVPGNAAGLYYLKIGDVISGLGLPPDGVSIEDYVEGNTTNLAIKGWHNGTATPNVVLADLLTEKKSDSKERPAKEYTVLVREHDNAIGSNTVAYASLGNLYGVTWATNWTEAVEHITKEETVKIVNWVTNSETIVTHVTNTVNWVTNEVISVTNTMNWVTNEVTWVTNSMTIVTNELVVITNTMNWVTNEMVIVTNTMNIVTNEMVVITNNINLITNEMVVVTNTLNLVTNEMVYVTNTLNLVTNEMVYITNTLSYVTNEIIYVTNTLNVISNQLNWVTNEVSILTNEYVVITNVTEKFNTIENWVVITNYLVNYLGGGDSGGGGGGGGGGGDAPPDIPPEHNPYSPQYKKDPLDEVTLPVKNAHVVIAITNEPLTMLESQNIFDFDVIDTNGLQLAQLRGFRAADASKFPMLPVKKKKVDITPPAGEAGYDPETAGDYALDWTEYPEELVKIAGGNSTIQRISSWLRSHTSQTNILELVATNYEVLAAMKTNLWSHVRVDTLLDNQSTWTNGAMQIEVKGYENALYNTHPVKVMGATANSTAWRHDATPDSEQVYDISYDLAKYNRSLERLDNYGVGGYSNISNVWQVYGFADAEVGQVPVKREESVGGHHSLHWEYAGNAIKLVGTDASTVSVGRAAETNTVTFASAGDSNVKVHVASDGVGGAVITFGVYYVQDSGSGGGGGSL